jgi:ketopantoate reductase
LYQDQLNNIGIIGGGAVGTATAVYLQNKGHDIKLYRRESKETDFYLRVMRNNRGIKIQNDNHVQGFDSEYSQIHVTTELDELKDSDLILVCTTYKSHKEMGLAIHAFNLKDNCKVIAFPGKLGSSYLLGDSGEISSSVFGVKQKVDYQEESLSVIIGNRKLGLEFAYKDRHIDENEEMVATLNSLFGDNSFVNGYHPLRVGLQNHDYSINVASMCDNRDYLLEHGELGSELLNAC